MSSIIEKFNRRADVINSLLCIGLDTSYDRLPEKYLNEEFPQAAFNIDIINTTHEYAAVYKPNIAFYEDQGEAGWQNLRHTMEYLQTHHPDIVTICDAKRGDIGSTNEAYVHAIFDDLGFDAITLHPYVGSDALSPFLQRADKACIMLCRTSNPGSGEIQDLHVAGKPLWLTIAETVASDWNENNNCMLVVGATYPNEMRQVRECIGEMPLLVPGIGAQGGNLEQTVRAGLNQDGKGIIINSSRGIIYSPDPAKSAQELRDAINIYR